jgi:hypothetical protein
MSGIHRVWVRTGRDISWRVPAYLLTHEATCSREAHTHRADTVLNCVVPLTTTTNQTHKDRQPSKTSPTLFQGRSLHPEIGHSGQIKLFRTNCHKSPNIIRNTDITVVPPPRLLRLAITTTRTTTQPPSKSLAARQKHPNHHCPGTKTLSLPPIFPPTPCMPVAPKPTR